MKATKSRRVWTGTAAAITLFAALAPARSPAGFGAELRPGDCILSWVRRSTTRTERCLECHDGSVGLATHVGRGDLGNHSVGIRYDETSGRGMLRPSAMIPREIVLVDGTISCTSCHDGSSGEPHHVAVSEERLCSGCHDV